MRPRVGRIGAARRILGLGATAALLIACSHVDETRQASGVADAPEASSAPAAGGPLNAALLALPEQRWVRIQPEPSKRYIPRQFEASNVLEDQPNPQGRDYSGLLYADGTLVYFGGGHAGYMGNDVEVYDIRRNVWTQSYRPDAAPENRPDPEWMRRLAPLSRPWVEHTYQVGCYEPPTRSVLWLLQYGGTMRLDLKTMQWKPLAGPHAGGLPRDTLVAQAWGSRACLGWDPDLKAALAMDTSNFKGVWMWRGRGWSQIAEIPPSNWKTPYSAYMPDRREYFIWNGESWWTFSAKRKRWKSVAAPANAQMYSFDYDTTNRVIVGTSYGDGPFRMWMVKLGEAATWTELPVSVPHPPQGFGRDAAPLLRYDPLHNVFFFIVYRAGGGGTSHATELWAWRYKKAASSP